MIVSATGKTAAAAAIGALSLMANEAPAQHRADSHAKGAIAREHSNRHMDMFYAKFGKTVGDGFFSTSLGYQLFPNPDRDLSIWNLRSHPSN